MFVYDLITRSSRGLELLFATERHESCRVYIISLKTYGGLCCQCAEIEVEICSSLMLTTESSIVAIPCVHTWTESVVSQCGIWAHCLLFYIALCRLDIFHPLKMFLLIVCVPFLLHVFPCKAHNRV